MVAFCFWIFLLSIMFSRFIHIVSCISAFVWPNNTPCTFIPQSAYPSTCWWTFGLFPPLGYCESWCCERTVHLLVWVLVFSYSGYIPRGRIVGSYYNSTFNFLRNLYFSTVAGGWPILHSMNNAWGFQVPNILIDMCYFPLKKMMIILLVRSGNLFP